MIKIYLASLILILSAACFIITNEIYKNFKNYKFINSKINKNHKELLEILQVHINRKNWLACIIKVEQIIKNKENLSIEYYNIIGYCYYSIKIYHLANYYYQQTIQQEPNNIIALFSLGKIYILTKKYKKAYDIYNTIIILDSNNKIAKKQVKILNKYL
uniref:hypothetical protein n=1 Tax=Hypnea wynnei TaxID=1867777 RepID=UPI0027DAAEC6|nr:hypothetical protein REP92_pgp172 [Hypnea wynnei]WCH56455.1 hypothetical protein [Hypnea wynnei]